MAACCKALIADAKELFFGGCGTTRFSMKQQQHSPKIWQYQHSVEKNPQKCKLSISLQLKKAAANGKVGAPFPRPNFPNPWIKVWNLFGPDLGLNAHNGPLRPSKDGPFFKGITFGYNSSLIFFFLHVKLKIIGLSPVVFLKTDI